MQARRGSRQLCSKAEVGSDLSRVSSLKKVNTSLQACAYAVWKMGVVSLAPLEGAAGNAQGCERICANQDLRCELLRRNLAKRGGGNGAPLEW